MEKLSIEEKAKAYDEALERAKKLQETCDSTTVVGWCEYIFQELRESKDEKIKKEIINYFAKGKEYLSLCSIGKDDILAWLEKQNSKKHEEELEKAYKTADKVQYRRGYEAAMKEMEKQGEISPILSNSSNIGKNAWSEEDEEHYKACLQYFDVVNPDMVYYKDYQWLKSLKQKIGGKQ